MKTTNSTQQSGTETTGIDREQDVRLGLPPLFYVLSAGRTGTVFLENLIKRHCPDVTAEHEPSPSRYLMMLGNLRNDTGLLARTTRFMARKHQQRMHGHDQKYIEINPFLCPVTDLLQNAHRPLRIVHIVRAPGDWAHSITTFNASTRYRHIINYVPFAKPFPAKRPEGWSRMTPFEKSLHRWNWCNSRIAALEPVADSYVLVRSEDIFSNNPETRSDALARIFATLELPIPEEINAEEFSKKVNPSPDGVDLRDAASEKEICGSLAATFGYEL